MNIYKVADNLRKTIAGKEKYLASIPNTRDMNDGAAMALEATRQFLVINIDELKKILSDVEVCVTQTHKAQQQIDEQGWQINPDRMGGQFTQDEIDNANKW